MQVDNPVYDIIIIGAGLVGASFAALLSQRIDTEKNPLRIALIAGGQAPNLPEFSASDPKFDPRVVALTHSSQALLQEMGVWQQIQQRVCQYTDMHVWDNEGTASIHFAAKEIQQTHLGSIAENSVVLHAVLQDLDTIPFVDIFRGTRVTTIEKSRDGSTRLGCDNDVCLRTSLVVAADGGQSRLRALADMPTREWDYQHKAIVATVESESSHQWTAWQNFLSSGPLAFLPLQHSSERYCSIVWSLETEKADRMMALDDQDFCHQLGGAFEHRLGKVVSVSQRFCFPLRQRHALDYHKDNIVLIGDAAHTIHPLAGQGVNLGLLDASALSNEIARALQRGLLLGDESVMRRYQRKRKMHNVEVMLLMEALKRLFGGRQLWLRWLRNTGLNMVNHVQPLKNWFAKQAIRHYDH